MQILDKTLLNPQLFGARIRQAREMRGLSQEEFAALISRDQRAVSEYEQGKRRLSAVDIPKLAKALNVPIIYFYEGEVGLNDLDRALLDEFHRLPTPEARQSAISILREFSQAIEQHTA